MKQLRNTFLDLANLCSPFTYSHSFFANYGMNRAEKLRDQCYNQIQEWL